MSEDPLDALCGTRAALAEISQADDEARRAVQQLEQLRRDQRTLLRRLYHDESPELRRLALRLVGGRDADDVAQEAFVSLIRWLGKQAPERGVALLSSPDEVRPLLFTMAVRRAYDVLRRRRDLLTESGNEIEQASRAREITPELRLEFERLNAAYRALPPLQRIAHVLHHSYGCSDSDLATTLGIPKATCRSLICRANRSLRRAMEIKS